MLTRCYFAVKIILFFLINENVTYEIETLHVASLYPGGLLGFTRPASSASEAVTSYMLIEVSFIIESFLKVKS